MKKILNALTTLIITGIFSLQTASAQFLTDTTGMSEASKAVADNAHYSNIRIEDVMARIIQIILSFLSIIFIIVIITAGFRWMTANGNEEHIQKAQHLIKAAIIGLIITLMTYSVTYFVFKYLPFSSGGGATGAV